MKKKIVVLIIICLAVNLCAGDVFTVPLNVNGYYQFQDYINFDIDLGVEFTAINDVHFVAEGDILALDAPGLFECTFITGAAQWKHSYGPAIFEPISTPFSCNSPFISSNGATWDFLLDGTGNGYVKLTTNVMFIPEFPPQFISGNIYSASLVIEGTVMVVHDPLWTLLVPSEYPTIQSAIDAAGLGDTVVVAPGTYYENIDFGGKDIILTSTDPDDWGVVGATVIDGGGVDRVVTFSGTETSGCELSGFTIRNGSAGRGGGIHGNLSTATISKCIVENNNATSNGGGLVQCYGTVTNCIVRGNTAVGNGGGLNNCQGDIINSLIYDNIAGYGGGINNCDSNILNCTIVDNTATTEGGGLRDCDGTVTNCVVWGNGSDELYGNTAVLTYNCVGGWSSGGAGNISVDPKFIDASGAANFRLQVNSPCIDTGDPNYVYLPGVTDLDGNKRVIRGRIDMGAYEMPVGIHVDGCGGSDSNDGLTYETAFATIQAGVDAASDGDIVLVWPCVYEEGVVFGGKAIEVRSAADAAVVRNPGGYAFTFQFGEGADSVLSNMVLAGGQSGVYANLGCTPTLRNLTVADNGFGIACYDNADPEILNSIFYNNANGDLLSCTAKNSWVEEEQQGSVDPMFADPNSDDYHLLSERGRYWAAHDIFVLDDVTSPCVDAGDPNAVPTGEGEHSGGRINQGAFGGTAFASMSEWPLRHDSNRDGRITLADFASFAREWLEILPWVE